MNVALTEEIVFDIETGPLPEDILAGRIAPYEPPPEPGAFHPDAVKLGNTKDPGKIEEKIEAARKRHQAESAAYRSNAIKDKADHIAKAKDRAALSPLTGQVLAIGYKSMASGKSVLDHVDDHYPEAMLLKMFWKQYARRRANNSIMVGHNIHGFDVPFIVRRSWLLGVDVPETVIERGRYIDSRVFVDTMTRWSCGGRDFVKLDTIASAMGVGGKPDGVTGAMFAELFVVDRPAALAYLQNDLDMTANVAERMGLV